MAHEIIMPKAGMAMEEGTIVRWLKREGEEVKEGEPLLEIETDKVSMEIEAAFTGVLIQIMATAGDIVPVTQVIGYIGKPGETPAPPLIPPAFIPRKTEQDTQPVAEIRNEPIQIKPDQIKHDRGKIAATPLAKLLARQRGIPLELLKPSGAVGQIVAKDVGTAKRAAITPLARKIADGMHADISKIAGSGYHGKINKEDVLKAVSHTSAVQEDTLVLHSAMRRVIAKRMLQSHLEIPAVTQNSMVDVTELMRLREKINLQNDTHISLNDLILLSVARTLAEQPRINASFTNEGLLMKKHIHIGMAVALPDGLIVPVIKDADKLSLKQISETSKLLAAKARDGKLTPDEYSGGTFTVSNLGMLGVSSFTPIINQPESAILGVCAVTKQLEMKDDGQLENRLKMGLSFTYDHRSIDGAQAAFFTQRVTDLLEHPLGMLE